MHISGKGVIEYSWISIPMEEEYLQDVLRIFVYKLILC